MNRAISGSFVAAALMIGAPLFAHHSVSAEFDVNKPVKLSGTIKKVDWTNPHIYTHVEVKEADGRTVVYRVEGAAPNTLFRQGWRKDTLKAGEAVVVQGLRAKNPESFNIGQATITTVDGRNVFGRGAGGGQREQ